MCFPGRSASGGTHQLADRLTRLANGTLPWPWIDPDKALPWVEKHIGLALAEARSRRSVLHWADFQTVDDPSISLMSSASGTSLNSFSPRSLRIVTLTVVRLAACCGTTCTALSLGD